MIDEKNDNNTASNSFKPIRDFLEGGLDHREVSIGVLATVIEQKGIYTWDRFGRFGKAQKEAENDILDLLARIHQYEYDGDGCVGHYQHPLDEAASLPWDPFSLFGWPITEKPDFEELAKQSKTAISYPKPQAKTAATKTHNTYLLIIGALCNKLGADYNCGERGAAVKIQKLIQEIGANCDDGTIRETLKKAQDVIDIKSK